MPRPTQHLLGEHTKICSSSTLSLEGLDSTTSKGTPPIHAKYRQGTSDRHDEELQSTITTPNPPTASSSPPRLQPSAKFGALANIAFRTDGRPQVPRGAAEEEAERCHALLAPCSLLGGTTHRHLKKERHKTLRSSVSWGTR